MRREFLLALIVVLLGVVGWRAWVALDGPPAPTTAPPPSLPLPAIPDAHVVEEAIQDEQLHVGHHTVDLDVLRRAGWVPADEVVESPDDEAGTQLRHDSGRRSWDACIELWRFPHRVPRDGALVRHVMHDEALDREIAFDDLDGLAAGFYDGWVVRSPEVGWCQAPVHLTLSGIDLRHTFVTGVSPLSDELERTEWFTWLGEEVTFQLRIRYRDTVLEDPSALELGRLIFENLRLRSDPPALAPPPSARSEATTPSDRPTPPTPRPANSAASDRKSRKTYEAVWTRLTQEEKGFPFKDLSHWVDIQRADDTRWSAKWDGMTRDKGAQLLATWTRARSPHPWDIQVLVSKLIHTERKGSSVTTYRMPFDHIEQSVKSSDDRAIAEGFYEDWIKSASDVVEGVCVAPKRRKFSRGFSGLHAYATATDPQAKELERREWYVWTTPNVTWVARVRYRSDLVEKDDLLDKGQEFMKLVREIR